MTPHDALKAANEELSGMQSVWQTLSVMVRAAERRAGEAETELNALLKARAAIGAQVEFHQRRVIELRTAEPTP